MTEEIPPMYACPGCGEPVGADEDYVVALEYEAEHGFSLHQMTGALGTERRFHVEHFRGRLGDRLFVLLHEHGV